MAADGFAPIDAVGNNEANPEWGTVGEQFTRLSPAAFEDGISTPARSDQANAREISNLISAQESSIENDRFITSMWFQWGQFLDHDINRVFDVAPFEQLTPTESLDISEDFPFNRSPFDPETGETTPREYVNHVTAFIDGSVVYGSEESHALALRTLEGGKLKSQNTDVGELLPFNTDGLINDPAPVNAFCIAGDVRSNENIGLTSMQTLWVREHNRIAEELATTEFADQELSDAEVDEVIYQRSRQIVMGLIQNITYNEFLPSTIGFNAIPTYSSYDATIDPQISDEFAATAYRLGHSTLTDELLIGSDGDSIPLAEAFFRPDIVSSMGIEGVLEGLTLQTMQEVDAQIVDAVRNFLDDGPGFDLAAINIQRGRDQGLPDYNTLRESIGLDRLSSFDEMTSNEDLADMFELIYGTPDNADPWIAMISEDHVPGTMTGETVYAILVDQFTRLRDGFFIPNALVSSPLADEGIDEFVITADIDFFEGYGLGGNDIWVFESDVASIFASGDDGTDVLKADVDVPGGEVALTGGEGRDSIVLSAPEAELAFVDGGGGHDRISVNAANAQTVIVEGGAGNDRINVRANGADSIAVSGDEGRDRINVRARAADLVLVSAGAGNDRVNVDARNAAWVEVLGDKGRDRLRVTVSRDTETNVDGGPGRDNVRVNQIRNHRNDHNDRHRSSRLADSTNPSVDVDRLARRSDELYAKLGRSSRR